MLMLLCGYSIPLVFLIFATNEISGFHIQFIFCPAGCFTMPGQGRYGCQFNAS